MICSLLPGAADLSAAAASRISRSLSFEDSPACQRLLHRVIEAGIGLLARQVPLASSKKSSHGVALRSRSVRSMPWREEGWDRARGAQEMKRTSRAQSGFRSKRMNSLQD